MRIKVATAAVHPSDVNARLGVIADYSAEWFPPAEEYVVGWDAAGVIDEVGEGVRAELAVVAPRAAVRAPEKASGRRRIDDRAALSVIAYVLDSNCAWNEFPESFPISSASAHRRFSEWVGQGVMEASHRATLDVLGAAGQIDCSRASIDAMYVRAAKGGT